jgi:hypothetical protein
MRTVDQLSVFWRYWYLIALFAAAVGATTFPLLYSFMVRWWENPLGRYMMYKGIVLAVALDWVTLRIFFPGIAVWVSVLLLTSITVMVWWYTILFLITWYKGRRARREDRHVRKAMKEDQNGQVN